VARKYLGRVHSKGRVGTTTAICKTRRGILPRCRREAFLKACVRVTTSPDLVGIPRRSCSPRRAPLIFHDARVTRRRHDRGWTVRKGSATRSTAPRRGQVLSRRGGVVPPRHRADAHRWRVPSWGSCRRTNPLPLLPRPGSRRGCVRRSMLGIWDSGPRHGGLGSKACATPTRVNPSCRVWRSREIPRACEI
jgi:hypothetical protein